MGERTNFSYYRQYDSYYYREYYVGDEAIQLRGVLKLTFPIDFEVIEDFNALERVLFYLFYSSLRVDPFESVVVFCLPYDSFSRRILEKICEILFETFSIKGLIIIHPAIATLVSTGKRTGTVVYLGSDLSYASNIYELSLLKDSVRKARYGFRNLVDYTRRLLMQKGYSFTTSTERIMLEDLCEKMSYIRTKFDDNMGETELKVQAYTMPDGEIISLGEERYLASELFFEPNLIGKLDEPSLPQIAQECISQIWGEKNYDPKQFNNILLTGQAAIPGMKNRLESELNKLSKKREIKVHLDPFRMHSNFIGSSILTSSKYKLERYLFSSDEYKVVGPSGIYKHIFM
ncbi:MAG: hypothetical protein GF383_11395 [Candidatus Lokiarchaeota archaeon]|nr:hypothetical protein [Candidatus Lokiarchaeota archaeon]MBD3341328.1 hypothetical protein [Candidatus Lokiarchaeota archaeon]